MIMRSTYSHHYGTQTSRPVEMWNLTLGPLLVDHWYPRVPLVHPRQLEYCLPLLPRRGVVMGPGPLHQGRHFHISVPGSFVVYFRGVPHQDTNLTVL